MPELFRESPPSDVVNHEILQGFEKSSVVPSLFATMPAFAADADNGKRLAHRWCAACHVVSATQHSATTDQAPPFATIAKIPGFDAAKVALFLLAPHPKMPDMELSRTEAGDLAAYIATLK
jgi:mono/diheme cytochrome c family protein